MATADKEIESIPGIISAFPLNLLLGPRTLIARPLDGTAQPLEIETTDIIDDFQWHRETRHAHSGAQHVWVRFRVAQEPAWYQACLEHEDKVHRLPTIPLTSLSASTNGLARGD